MTYVMNEIMSYLNTISVTKNNFDDLKILYRNKEKELYPIQENLECFRKNQNYSDIKINDFKVICGENPTAVLTVKIGPIDNRKDCTYHRIGSDDGIVLKLAKEYSINFIKMRLYDEKMRAFSYFVQVSIDNENWNTVYDQKIYQCRSWQLIYFPENKVQYIKIVGTKSHDIIECNYFEVSSIEIFKTDNPMVRNGILCPKQDMAKMSVGAKLLRGTNTWILRDESNKIDKNSDINFTYHNPYSDILIQLPQVIEAETIKLITWGEVRYEFSVKSSKDNEKWDVIYEYNDESSEKFEHLITFKSPKLISFIKIFGENVDENDETDETFRIVSFQCPALLN
jgi:BTB/POZ domain-containing protein 9